MRILFTFTGEIVQGDVESKIKYLEDQPSVYQRKIDWGGGKIYDQLRKNLNTYDLIFYQLGYRMK